MRPATCQNRRQKLSTIKARLSAVGWSHRLHDRWKPPIQLEEEQAIAVPKLDPTTRLALQHD
jgi:hypothetical protein